MLVAESSITRRDVIFPDFLGFLFTLAESSEDLSGFANPNRASTERFFKSFRTFPFPEKSQSNEP